MVGIISNTSALQAQSNLEQANKSVQNSISRLSSGERIVNASDDVAGLAIGTVLKTNVSTLKSVLTNTAQAQSLLSLADSALENVSDLLQRQKALASQATSGTLDDKSRSFLNQEFINLKSEINRISETTNFNGIKLIDGSLFDPAKMVTDTRDNATAAGGKLQIAAALTAAETITITSGADSFSLEAVAVDTFAAGDDSLLQFDLAGGNNGVDEIITKFEQIMKYSGTDTDVLAARKVLSRLSYSATDDIITFTAKGTGAEGNNIKIASDAATADEVLLDGVDIGGTNKIFGDGGTIGADGALNAGTFPAAGTAYSGTGTTITQGTIGDSLLTAITTTVIGTTGVATNNISNNPAFVGKISGFAANYASNQVVDLEITVGDVKYQANGVSTNYAADTVITLTSSDPGYGSFDIQFDGGKGESSVTNQSEADVFAARLDKAFSSLEFFQKREVTSFQAAGTVFPTGSTTASGDLSKSKIYAINSDFDNIKIENVSVSAPPAGASNAIIEFTVNGETYSSGYDDAGTVSALGTTVTNNANFTKIGFVNKENPNKMLVLHYHGNGTDLSIATDAEAEGLQTAFKTAFGIGNGDGGKAGLEFQVGTSASDKIDVQIAGTKVEKIFVDNNGIFKDVTIDTQANAAAASEVLDNAINTVISTRSNLGSLQSRFEFAASNIRSSIANVDSARSVFLDADVPSESTELAQAQVRLQASISTLAQANQLPQSLLKLIG